MESIYAYKNTVPLRWMHISEMLPHFFMPHLVLAKTSVDSCLSNSQSVKVSEWQHNHLVYHSSSQVCIICKIPEGALCPTVWVINEDVEQYWSQYQPLGYSTTDWTGDRFCAANPNPFESGSSASSQYASLSVYHIHIPAVRLWGCYGRRCQKPC